MFVSRIDDVARLHAQGLTGRKIAERLGVTPPEPERQAGGNHSRRIGVTDPD